MRFELVDLISRPEPSSTPAITLWLAAISAAALAGSFAALLGSL